MNITAQMVKELREKTGAGMLDCKNALKECDGNMDASIDWLREKGIAKAAKKADRIAAEGLTRIASNDTHAVIIELNSETDFVAKNEQFQALIDGIAQHLLATLPADLDAAMASTIEGKDLATFLAEATAKIGEKLTLRRFAIVTKDANGAFGEYLHMGGRIGTLVVLENSTDSEIAKDVAMHAAAMNPQFISSDDVSPEFIEKERHIQLEITKNDPKTADKPENVLKGIVEGKLKKQLKEICLTEQSFVKNPDVTVGQFVKDAKIVTVIRYEVGEGIEKAEVDFAAEVMAQVNQ